MPEEHRLARIVALTACLAAAACTSIETQPGPTPDCHSHATCQPGDLFAGCGQCVSATAVLDLGLCKNPLSVEDVEDTLALSVAFVNALPKLRESRGLSDRLANALREMPAAIADDPRSDHLPVPFQPAEKGTYTAPLVAAGSGTLSVRVRFGSDYEAGQSDDLIDPSPFRPDAYLVDPKLDTSGPTEQLSYGATGPLVELLGFGASPPNPLPVDDPTLETELGKQILDCQTSVDDSAPEARIVRFAVRVRRRVLADLPLGDGTSQGTLEDDMHGDQGMFGEQGACFAGTTFAASASVRRGTR